MFLQDRYQHLNICDLSLLDGELEWTHVPELVHKASCTTRVAFIVRDSRFMLQPKNGTAEFRIEVAFKMTQAWTLGWQSRNGPESQDDGPKHEAAASQ